MERVTFLLEDGAERVSCLLNPERLMVRRSAGAVPRRSLGGLLSGRAQSDDPLLAVGGGVTELDLELLFDTSLTDGPARAEDVRELTRPLWRFADGGGAGLTRVRFLWGKAWNVPGVVLAASEQFEAFGVGGAPQRSWLRLRLRRVAEPQDGEAVSPSPFLNDSLALPPVSPLDPSVSIPGTGSAGVLLHEVKGGPDGGERVDTLAWRYYGQAALWRVVATAGALTDPLSMAAGTVLRLPALTLASLSASASAAGEQP